MQSFRCYGVMTNPAHANNVIIWRAPATYTEPSKGIGRTASNLKLDWSLIVRSGALRPLHVRRL